MNIETINPFTGEKLQSYSTMSLSELEDIVQKSAQAYSTWSQESLKLRSNLIAKVGEALEQEKSQLAEIISKEMGKPIQQSISEIEKSAWLCRHFAENGEGYLTGRTINLDENQSAKIVYQPTGTILGIMPWNFPVWQVIRFMAPTILAGNAVILRHASNVTASALALTQIIARVLPENLFNFVLCDHDQVEDIIKHDSITGISLTGSSAAGKIVAELAGRYLKKTLLELGGADPYLVLPGADVSEAAKSCVKSRMNNSGQSCIAAKRFIVHKDISKEFTDAVCAQMESYELGNPLDEKTTLGPLARQDLQDDLHEQVNEILKNGAKLKIGGQKLKSPGFFYAPTVLTEFSNPNLLGKTELFGPVASIIKADSVEHMISIANHSIYGLGGAVFSKDLDLAQDVALKIATGSVAINSFVQSDPRVPFGGIKESGMGREMSAEGIKEFCNVKAIVGPKDQ